MSIKWNWYESRIQLVIPPRVTLIVEIEFNSELEQSVSIPELNGDAGADPKGLLTRDVLNSHASGAIVQSKTLLNKTGLPQPIYIEPLYKPNDHAAWEPLTNHKVAVDVTTIVFGFEFDGELDFKDMIIRLKTNQSVPSNGD